MVLLGELLAICNKGEVRNLMLEFHYKDKDSGEKRHFKIPMVEGHYIADNIWYSKLCRTLGDLKSSTPINNVNFVYEMERECLNDNCWGDLYESPMEQLGNCELRFCNNFVGATDTEFETVGFKETDTEIIVVVNE